jgi:nucleotide-binding universal stress UspA family protein
MKASNISRVALATAFSPRFLPGLAEGRRFAARLEAAFSIIHTGERTVEKETILAEAMEHLGIPPETQVLWRSGEPVEAIIHAAEEAGIHLLIAGALIREREVSGRIFVGSVARGLLQRGSCSLLLITKPQIELRRYRRIAMVTDFSEGARNAFRAALALAEQDEAECLHVIAIRSPFAAARLRIEQGEAATDNRETLLEEFAGIAAGSPVMVERRVIESNTGIGAADFITSIEADLLVVPTAASQGPTLLPPQMDWVSQVIPCDLWVVKKPPVQPSA